MLHDVTEKVIDESNWRYQIHFSQFQFVLETKQLQFQNWPFNSKFNVIDRKSGSNRQLGEIPQRLLLSQ